MSPSRIFIERPIATTLFMAAILLAGIFGYLQLPTSALPEVDYPIIQVVTFYPGANPEVMASSVTAPLERQLGQVPGLQQMTSVSSDGSSVITLQFNLGLNIDVAQQEVQQSINASGTYLPADLPNPPIYSKTNPADAPVLTLALTSDTLPLPQVEDLADTRLAQKISQVSGVGLVSIVGGQKPAVRIQANPTALSSYGINLEDVRTAIAAANVNQAKGNFDGSQQSFQIGANDQLLTSADYADLIIAYRNNAPVRLSSVARVLEATENNRQAAWAGETPAIIVNIQRQPGANTIAVVDRIRQLLPRLQQSLPAAVHVQILTDRTETIRASVEDVEFELGLTIALVVMVIFLFLRSLSATFIPGVAVPLSLVGTCGAMYFFGFSLNNLTLMALTISTGFVVDDAIVMIENIVRHIEDGQEPYSAALEGAGQIGFTIVSLTISLIAVMIPLLFMGDIVGRLFREFAITLSLTILISALVSLTLTPMLCSRLLRRQAEQRAAPGFLSRIEQGLDRLVLARFERAFNQLIERYGRTLQGVLRHQGVTLLVALGTLALTFFLYLEIPKGLFPIQDTGIIQGISQASQSISFAAMAQKQQALTRALLQDPAVATIASFIGVDGTNTTLNSGRLQITLKPLAQRHDSATAIIARLQPLAAAVEGISLYLQPVQDLTVEDRVSRTQYQLTLEDPDGIELNTWAPRLLRKLQALPELQDAASDQQTNGLRAHLTYDRATAARLGLTAASIDNTLYDAFGQRQVSTMFTELNQYHVILEIDPHLQRNPADLQQIYLTPSSGGLAATASSAASGASSLATSTGGASGPGGTSSPGATGLTTTATPGPAPLGSFAHWETGSGPLTINHQGQFPVITLSFNLAPSSSLSQAVSAITRAEAELELPPGVEVQYQGATEAFQASLSSEPLLILAALVTVYIVLGVLYESFIHPITILSTLPSAGVGALFALRLTGHDLNIIALIGIILLIGIVQKNAIMMVDFALAAEREQELSALDAIYQACLLRFRPIIMTTLAALLGGLPLALGGGVGAELRRPLGIAIVGGLIVSQVLTLFTTPVIYLAFDRLGRWLTRQPPADPILHPQLESHPAGVAEEPVPAAT